MIALRDRLGYHRFTGPCRVIEPEDLTLKTPLDSRGAFCLNSISVLVPSTQVTRLNPWWKRAALAYRGIGLSWLGFSDIEY